MSQSVEQSLPIIPEVRGSNPVINEKEDENGPFFKK